MSNHTHDQSKNMYKTFRTFWRFVFSTSRNQQFLNFTAWHSHCQLSNITMHMHAVKQELQGTNLVFTSQQKPSSASVETILWRLFLSRACLWSLLSTTLLSSLKQFYQTLQYGFLHSSTPERDFRLFQEFPKNWFQLDQRWQPLSAALFYRSCPGMGLVLILSWFPGIEIIASSPQRKRWPNFQECCRNLKLSYSLQDCERNLFFDKNIR